jgi:LysM repeat protein
LEDEVYTRCVSQFPFDPQAVMQSMKKESNPDIMVTVDLEDERSEKKIREFNETLASVLPFTLHRISKVDTLPGLALRYGVTVSF